MKIKHLGVILLLALLSSCISIPKETVTLSQTLGNDIVILHNSHRNMVNIHYNKIEGDINHFIDDVYAPFVIHFVLKQQMEEYKNGNPSIYGIIVLAGEVEGKTESEDAINVMHDFQKDAIFQIESKRRELINPIKKQRREIINSINQSYENLIYANSTLTAYLISARKVKDSQQKALSIIGLEGADQYVTETLVKASEKSSELLEKGKEIDIKSEEALKQLQKITEQYKKLTNKE